MPIKENSLPRDTDEQEYEESSIIQVEIPKVASVREYVREHTVHSWAANDSHRFALADFLIQHQRARANAQLEPDSTDT